MFYPQSVVIGSFIRAPTAKFSYSWLGGRAYILDVVRTSERPLKQTYKILTFYSLVSRYFKYHIRPHALDAVLRTSRNGVYFVYFKSNR